MISAYLIILKPDPIHFFGHLFNVFGGHLCTRTTSEWGQVRYDTGKTFEEVGALDSRPWRPCLRDRIASPLVGCAFKNLGVYLFIYFCKSGGVTFLYGINVFK